MDDKQLLRAGVLRRREQRDGGARAEAGQHLAAHAGLIALRATVVAAYAGVGGEPPTRALLEALRRLGVQVLLPVVAGSGLDWAEFSTWAELHRTERRLLEPSGAALGVEAAAAADLVLVPALAVDRTGSRLGRGAGFYDRWLPLVPQHRRIAVVYDDEVLDTVPHEPHDARVGGVLTPRRGLVTWAQ